MIKLYNFIRLLPLLWRLSYRTCHIDPNARLTLTEFNGGVKASTWKKSGGVPDPNYSSPCCKDGGVRDMTGGGEIPSIGKTGEHGCRNKCSEK